ncbi:hypothetical protein GJ744_000386 [Endocarpon pusillum]|uniref:Uncharacterized protein n=1 Tax=Endocarpon pusillum TaxID=364733 RepID=A0A8H7E3Z9_9EURO|nr:hypothetical protein GJ744_000386 [Endocarpon pusillum]
MAIGSEGPSCLRLAASGQVNRRTRQAKSSSQQASQQAPQQARQHDSRRTPRKLLERLSSRLVGNRIEGLIRSQMTNQYLQAQKMARKNLGLVRLKNHPSSYRKEITIFRTALSWLEAT